MNVEQKLSKNKFSVDEGNPHISVDSSRLDADTIHALTVVCPAGLYSLGERGELHFDAAGCLECGTCRIVCAGHPGAMSWTHPRPSFGVTYRFG
ncbi:MAG: ferredoxin family protein [Telmatospirillum sp.]|nr:ferredoxin family protein [Telmatospirillum sp.]